MKRQQSISKMISKELLILIFTVVSILTITVLTTVSGSGFDLSRLSKVEIWTNIILNSTFVLATLLVAIPYGKLNTMCKKTPEGGNGKYLTSFNNFNKAYDAITCILYQFSQWHVIKYKKEVKEKQYRYLIDRSIPQIDNVLKLNRRQIEQLGTPQMFVVNGEELYFGKYSKKQIEHCLKVYDGRVSLHKLPDSYFLYVDGKAGASFYEQAYYESKLQTAYTISNILSKVCIYILMSCVLTSLVIDVFVIDKQTLMKIIINLISRIMSVCQALYGGYMIGQNIVYRKCYYIDGRTQVLTEFRTDASFTYRDPNVVAKEQYLEDLKDLEERSSYESESERQVNILD